ncbi:MFS transporter [Glutamicibacter sp.]|uniref:MFS transporter n=1 Tax=Glutamicibacter sp. TaxID=1931995 RepID=UPI003D6C6728
MTWQRGFGVLWAANALSNLADGLAFIALPLLAASLTSDARLIAGLPLGYAVVRMLFALPIGVWVDRFERRGLLSAANILRGLALLALASCFQFDGANLLLLYLAMALISVLEGICDSAAVAILPQLELPGNLDRANSKIAATQLLADEFAGPPLGGVLFAAAAAVPLYSIGGLWTAAGLIALALPRGRARSIAAGERSYLWTEAREGISWLAKHRVVGALALIGGLASVGYMLPFSILVLFARERLGLDSAGYGMLLAFSAVGGLLGSAIAPKLRRVLGFKKLIVSSLALGALSLGVLSFAASAILAGIMLALYIMHAVIWNICSLSLRQQLVPENLMGRVSAAGKVLGLLGLALGAAAGGLLGTISLALPVAAGAVVFAFCALQALSKLERATGYSR